MSQANLSLSEAYPGRFLFFYVSLPKMSVGSTTSSQRSNGNPCSGNTPLLPLQRRPRWCHRQGRWWSSSSWMQRALCSLTTFRKANLSMGNTMPTCWGSCERKSSQNGMENWRRESCFTRTMLLWLQWLMCVTVALNWLITLHILLIWYHLTMNPGLNNVSICSQHENCQISLKIVSTMSQNSS